MSRRTIYFILAGFSITVAWIASPFVVERYIPDLEQRGQFGDQFGAITALFNGLAFLGLIFTIYQQHIELGLQREELAQTRNELRKAADAQEASQKALKEQVLAQRDSAVIAAMDTLIRLNRDIVDKDCMDEVARRMPHYGEAKRKLAQYAEALEQKINQTL